MLGRSPEADEDSLICDVPDDVLERAATVAGGAVTVAYCTYWHECGWPFRPIDWRYDVGIDQKAMRASWKF